MTIDHHDILSFVCFCQFNNFEKSDIYSYIYTNNLSDCYQSIVFAVLSS